MAELSTNLHDDADDADGQDIVTVFSNSSSPDRYTSTSDFENWSEPEVFPSVSNPTRGGRVRSRSPHTPTPQYRMGGGAGSQYGPTGQSDGTTTHHRGSHQQRRQQGGRPRRGGGRRAQQDRGQTHHHLGGNIEDDETGRQLEEERANTGELLQNAGGSSRSRERDSITWEGSGGWDVQK